MRQGFPRSTLSHSPRLAVRALHQVRTSSSKAFSGGKPSRLEEACARLPKESSIQPAKLSAPAPQRERVLHREGHGSDVPVAAMLVLEGGAVAGAADEAGGLV